MNIFNINFIHFIGIGGIGISAIANILLTTGKNISGSDICKNEIIDNLRHLGAKIIVGKHHKRNVTNSTDLVIYSNAVTSNNPELLQAKKLNIPVMPYPEFLGKYMQKYIPIVISGTHGKSTATSLISEIFIKAKLDPTIIVGSKILSLNSNSHLGLGRHIIVEGDEYKAAFLNYKPFALIINNIEADHLDFFHSIKEIKLAFLRLVKKVDKKGVIIFNHDDKLVREVVKMSKCKKISYGIRHGNIIASHMRIGNGMLLFRINGPENFDIKTSLLGNHNVYNILASVATSIFFGISSEIIKKTINEFKGIGRRFETVGKYNNSLIIDDYAHHPTAINVTLKSAKKFYPSKKIVCVFQPHSYHRTKSLLNDFVDCFKYCDKLILTNIFSVAGRETSKFNDATLFNIINLPKEKKFFIDNKKLFNYVKKMTGNNVIIFMGAGDINKYSRKLIEQNSNEAE